MDAETRPAFSSVCPACGAARIQPVVQRNDFAAADRLPGGRVAPGAERVSTTREYHCRGCGRRWAETVPRAAADSPVPDGPADRQPVGRLRDALAGPDASPLRHTRAA